MMNPFAKKTTNEDIAIRDNKKGFKTFSTGELMAEKMSICVPCEYMKPRDIDDLDKNGPRRFRELFKSTNADSFNASMVDEYIDKKVQIGIDSIIKQHEEHLHVIADIMQAQRSRVNRYQHKLETCLYEIGQIKAAYPDFDSIDSAYASKRQGARIPFYKNKICLLIVLALSTLLDYTTISSAVDSLLTQNVFLSILLSIGVAGLINLTPSIAGVYARNKNAQHRKLVLVLLGGIFLVLFAILCGLRWATRDVLYADTSILFGAAETAHSDTDAELFMTILLSAEPALTSCLSFVFGFIGSTEEEKEKELAEKHLGELYGLKDELEIRICELSDVMDRNINYIEEEEKFKAKLEEMEHYRELFKETARMVLAEIVAESEGNGIILQRENAVSY